jgi:hypothetical protein
MQEPFAPNSDVVALIPKAPMTLAEKVFYAVAITQNRFKFSYGRKPKGERLGQILLPTGLCDVQATLAAYPYSKLVLPTS